MNKKKLIAAITTLVVGVLTLIVGIIFLVLNLTSGSAMQDGEYLVSRGEWVLEGTDKVIWNFTEIGKGTLTTNGHENDYDFKWAIKDEQLLIETEWLYNMENAYEYQLDQNAGTLILTDGDGTYSFKAQ